MSWPALWDDYMLDAKHWTPQVREKVFGPSWGARPATELGIYSQDGLDDLGESDRLFIRKSASASYHKTRRTQLESWKP